MREDIFDNRYIFDSEKASDLVKTFFKENLPLYTIQKDYITPTGQWGVEFVYLSNKVLISSDRGYLDTEITLNSKPMPLFAYEPKLENAKASSEKNICLVLNVVKEMMTKQQT
jgi:hypothetical protein